MKKSIIRVISVILLLSLALCGCQKYEILDGIEYIPTGSMQISCFKDGNNATCASPYITWTQEAGAEDYVVQIATDAEFKNIVESRIVTANRYSVTTVLSHKTEYFVRIIARKTVEGEKYAFAVAKSSFVTADVHDTSSPDYSATRTLFDFEDYTTESFNDLFSMNAGGDTVTAEIVEGAGVDGSKALKLTGEKGSMGWSAMACSSLPTGKKVWVGTTGLRLHIRAEEGTSVKFSVKVGKRGYQTWSKSFIVKNEEGVYITIPYEVMVDQGGGDGIWDLSVMTFIQFTFNGEGTVYIDDITVGSTEEYRYDTTANASKGLAPGIIENFEGDDIASKISDNFNIQSVDSSLTAVVESGDGSGHELYVKLWQNSSMIQPRKLPYELTKYDYTQVDGITFKFKISKVNSGANILIKFGSYLNIYTATYSLADVQANEYVTIKIPFSALTLADDGVSSGALDYTKIDTLQIFIKESQYCHVYIDDIGFYKD